MCQPTFNWRNKRGYVEINALTFMVDLYLPYLHTVSAVLSYPPPQPPLFKNRSPLHFGPFEPLNSDEYKTKHFCPVPSNQNLQNPSRYTLTTLAAALGGRVDG